MKHGPKSIVVRVEASTAPSRQPRLAAIPRGPFSNRRPCLCWSGT